MKTRTTRFGDFEVDEKEILTASEGPLGFQNLKEFILIEPDDQTMILWFQSLEYPAVAFPVIEPRLLFPDYRVELPLSELKGLDLLPSDEACLYLILTIPRSLEKTSANLKAPLVFNFRSRRARQIILSDSKLEICCSAYTPLKELMTNHSQAHHTRNDASRFVKRVQIFSHSPEIN